MIFDFPQTMDIHSKKGDKVIHSFPQNGSDYDIEKNAKILSPDSEYTVANIEVGQSRSYVSLEEHPGEVFNTVCFTNKEVEE